MIFCEKKLANLRLRATTETSQAILTELENSSLDHKIVILFFKCHTKVEEMKSRLNSAMITIFLRFRLLGQLAHARKKVKVRRLIMFLQKSIMRENFLIILMMHFQTCTYVIVMVSSMMSFRENGVGDIECDVCHCI